jgi:flagellar protein FlgJ
MAVNNQFDSVYTDFRGLTQLQYKAATNSPKALREVGKQFEALFIQMMLKSMREATPGDPLLGGKDEELYRDLFDKQISMNMAAKSQLGLADMIVRQLQRNAASQIPSQDAAVQSHPLSAPATERSNANSAGPAGTVDQTAYSSPAEFVKAVWPYAQQAAKELNVDPRVLVAQAALETGWGSGVASHPDGRSTNNLFGIKAGSNWEGDAASVSTLEFRDGIAVKERAQFRSYPSVAEGFHDYVRFLQNNPRYREALSLTDDPRQFTDALQKSGYATDPRYADKIRNVLSGDTMATALADLKLTEPGPIG